MKTYISSIYLQLLKLSLIALMSSFLAISLVNAQDDEEVELTKEDFDLGCCQQYCDSFPAEQRTKICKDQCWTLPTGSPCLNDKDLWKNEEDCKNKFSTDCKNFCAKAAANLDQYENRPLFKELLKHSNLKMTDGCVDPKKSSNQLKLDSEENAKIDACKKTLTIDCLDQLDRCRKSPDDTYCKGVAAVAGTGWTAAKPAIEEKIKELITTCLPDPQDALCLSITDKCNTNKGLYEYCDRDWSGKDRGFLAVQNKLEMKAKAAEENKKQSDELFKEAQKLRAESASPAAPAAESAATAAPATPSAEPAATATKP